MITMLEPSGSSGSQVRHAGCYREVTIVSAGAPIVLSIWRGDPGAATVVFLPGTMTHPLFYREFLEGLHRRGLSVVGVHYQGHGKSPRIGSRLRWANLMINAADAVDWAADHLAGPVVLLGSSQGGILAMTVAGRSRKLALVAAHNVLDPALPESLTISRLPRWLVGAYRPLLATLRLAARLAPELPVPFWAYLDLDRVCGQPDTRRRFLTDPLGLRAYPLGFLAELGAADLSGMRDGSIGCPVLVVAGRGDPLFSFGYTRRVFDRIVAPTKELLVFEVDRHLLFNECVELVTDPLVDRIHRLVPMPGSAGVPCH
ncbi:MAG TPA: alpha/beta fold hydrolase [Actinomycetes bacterium]|nr:alpha/beta fold hydrolase [Actinomycetes bacterium]